MKQRKNKFDPGSYRPICNLTSIDKVIQEWFRIQIVEYLDENQILSDAHHGSRPGFSTLTAKNTIDYLIGRGSETGKLTMLINTDLSAACDIVDHELLLKKFEFYGFSEDSRRILGSILKDRMQYTEIEGFKSSPILMPNTSVLQGSKLSGICFILFIK